MSIDPIRHRAFKRIQAPAPKRLNREYLWDSGPACWTENSIEQWCQMKLRFGPFELASRERALRRDGLVLPLGSRALDILIYLADRAGDVVTKKELIDRVWPDVFVEEGVLRVHVASIRKVLGDGQFGNRYIANIYGRGYSFVSVVVRLEDSTVDHAPGFHAET
jgi:DNA-binding winged helix-turn-helix (wHTH) protein